MTKRTAKPPALTPVSAPTPRRSTDWHAVVDMLTAAPGQWHELHDPPSTSSFDIRRGMPLAFSPPGAFDAVTRGTGPRRRLFLRYVGPPTIPLRDPATWAPTLDEHGEPYTFDTVPRDPDYRDAVKPGE